MSSQVEGATETRDAQRGAASSGDRRDVCIETAMAQPKDRSPEAIEITEPLEVWLIPWRPDPSHSRTTRKGTSSLPWSFRVDPAVPPDRPMAALQLALRRHRLLFLWHAQPWHGDLPRSAQPDKHELFRSLSLQGQHGTAPRSADKVFEHADALDAWLSNLHDRLRIGHGRPLVTNRFPSTPLAQWQFDPDVPTPLADSEREIARLVGVALRSPVPAWLSREQIELIQACAQMSQPAIVSDEFESLWSAYPIVRWD